MEAVLGAAANSSFIDKFYGSKKNNNHGTNRIYISRYTVVRLLLLGLHHTGSTRTVLRVATSNPIFGGTTLYWYE